MATDSALGTRIRKRRQVLRLKQHELADLLGVDRTAVSNWERGRHLPTRYIGALENVLGISLDDSERPEYDDPGLQEVWEQTEGLPDDKRRHILRVVEGMREDKVDVPGALRERFREAHEGQRGRGGRSGNGGRAG